MGEVSIHQRSCECSDCRVLFFSETGRRRICDVCKKQKNSKRVREWKRFASFADSDVEFAWDYKNLQPIDSEENLKKGSLFMGMRWRR